MSRTSDVLQKANDLQESRAGEYEGALIQTGPIFKALFPNGIHIESETDMARFATLNNVIMKLNRYCQNFDKGGHEDSAIDLVAYAAILVVRTEDSKNDKLVRDRGSKVWHDDCC